MKKVLSLLSLCLVVALVSFTTLNTKKRIVIDAGHGGHDHGAMANDINEKDIVAQISKKIFEQNDPSKVEIILLRHADDFLSLTDRVNKINELNPDLIISLHVNSSSKNELSGVEAYVSENNNHLETSRSQAEKIIKAIANDKLKLGKVKQANFTILKKSNCPAVSVELGFISNESDRKYITSEEGQNEIAANILKSIQ